jgi:hypothetical protein
LALKSTRHYTPSSSNDALSRKCTELETERAFVKAEREDYAATVDEFIKDHKRWQLLSLTPEKCESVALLRSADRILNALEVGKPSPQHKRVKAVLAQMMP